MSKTLEDALYGAYDIPENAPKEVKSDSPEYYKHPKGSYTAIIGSMQFKFENMNGKKCEPNDLGATAVRTILKLLIKSYTNEEGVQEQLLGNDLHVPDDRTAPELYFPLMLSLKRTDQWRIEKMLGEFVIPEIANSEIVKDKLVRYGKIQLYFGLTVKFVIQHGEKKGSPYIESIALLNEPREDIEHVKEVEKMISDKMQSEIDMKKLEKGINDTLPGGPAKTADEIFGVSSDADTGEFNNDDLPF